MPFDFKDVISTIIFASLGAAYGMVESSTGILSVSAMRLYMDVRSILLVVLAGVLNIYGLIVTAIISEKMEAVSCLVRSGRAHLDAGPTHERRGAASLAPPQLRFSGRVAIRRLSRLGSSAALVCLDYRASCG